MPIELIDPFKLGFWNYWERWITLIYLHSFQCSEAIQMRLSVTLDIFSIWIVRACFCHWALLVSTTLFMSQWHAFEFPIFVEIWNILLL